MSLVASSSPPFSPPPPCGDEKEEDSSEEEEADGGGGAPRDLGWAGARRGGLGTASVELRVPGNSLQRTCWSDQCCRALLPAWLRPGPSHLPLPFLLSPHPSQATATRRREKGTSPTPPWVAAELGSPPIRAGRGPRPEEEISSGFSFFFLGCISERIKNGRECGGTGAAFCQAA